MPDLHDWNQQTIAEFRANGGRLRDVTGNERDRIYDEQARRYPGFAEYARQTAGIRTIPVLELQRA